MYKIPKQESRLILLSFAALLFITVQFSLRLDLRRLGDTSYIDPIEDLSEFYNTVFNRGVTEEFRDIQRKVRIISDCEAKPDIDTAPEDFDGVDHVDSHVATISCVPTHYRIPSLSTNDIKDTMVFGILSLNRSRRDVIRDTWGDGKRIFFLVAGNWGDIEDEYNEFGDMIWTDMLDRYRIDEFDPRHGALTTKTSIFLYAMHTHVLKENPDIKYIFKTDDDSYVDKIQLEREIGGMGEVNYWGNCREGLTPIRDENNRWYASFRSYPYTTFPPYCQGSGYVMSTKFLDCAVGEGNIETMPYNVNEDVFAGLLAERCDMSPNLWSLSTVHEQIRENLDSSVAVQHNVPSDKTMLMLHGHSLRDLRFFTGKKSIFENQDSNVAVIHSVSSNSKMLMLHGHALKE